MIPVAGKRNWSYICVLSTHYLCLLLLALPCHVNSIDNKKRIMAQEISITIQQPRRAYRLAVSCLFFLQGICFASWASRIPTIQTKLALSDAALGGILLALP